MFTMNLLTMAACEWSQIFRFIRNLLSKYLLLESELVVFLNLPFWAPFWPLRCWDHTL